MMSNDSKVNEQEAYCQEWQHDVKPRSTHRIKIEETKGQGQFLPISFTMSMDQTFEFLFNSGHSQIQQYQNTKICVPVWPLTRRLFVFFDLKGSAS